MPGKFWIHKQSFNINRGIRWRLGASLTFGLLLAMGTPEHRAANSQIVSAPAQDPDRLAARKKFEEGEALRAEGTVESLRLAVRKYEEALLLCRTAGDRKGEAVILSHIGLAYNSLGERRKALDFHIRALSLSRANSDRRGTAITLSNVSEIYKSLGEWRKAIASLNQALALHSESGDRPGQTRTLSSLGYAYSSLGENQKALDMFTQALALQRKIGDPGEEAIMLNNIGAVYNSLGDWGKALDFYAQALRLRRAAGDGRGEAKTLNNMGLVYDSLGEWQKALDYYTQALELNRAVGERGDQAVTLNNMGLVYDSLGENQKALDYYTQALPLLREAGAYNMEATTLNNIGVVYHSLDDWRKALGFYNQALALHRAAGARRGEAETLNNVGEVYKLLGENQKALDFHNRSLLLYRAVNDRHGEARVLSNIGSVYSLAGENQKALGFYNRALELDRAAGASRGEAITLSNIAYAKRALGHFDESRSCAESVLNIIESIRANVVIKELRASFFAKAQESYEFYFYIDLLMEMHGREPTKGYDAVALEASERARARSLVESLVEARANIRRGADPKLLARERSLQRRLNAKAAESLKFSADGADEARLAALRRETDALIIELQQVQTLMRQTSPRYSALTQPRPLTLAEIQQQALDADTLLLEYSLGDERSFLWAVTPTTVNSYELPKRETIEAAARRVYGLLSDTPGMRSQTAKPGDSGLKEAGDQYFADAADLSRMLLGPVAGRLGKKRLLIVADGMLHYIPFGALPDPNNIKEGDGRRQPLVVEHEIVNLPSASTLAVLRRELAGRKPAARMLAVLADPVFTIDDDRIKPGARIAARQTAYPTPNPLNESIARKLVQAAGGAPAASPRDLRINRLPFTRLEAERIIAIAPPGAAIKALDFEASRATATSDRLSQYRYIHFATHGLADSERPELSAVALSLYDEQGRAQDGFLRAHEVYNLELPAELVTLSACETGLGKLTRGEGLMSLTRGFMYAGAARVVVSLWSVSDRATAELMEKFYRRMLVERERPAAALRSAQVEMWRDKRWAAPYYWAAFTLQGEWR